MRGGGGRGEREKGGREKEGEWEGGGKEREDGGEW